MRYSLELLHKPIVSADRNEKLGLIHGYVVDPDARRVAAFVLEQFQGEHSYHVVPFSATKSIYTDAVIVENLPGPLPLNDAPQLMELLLKDIALIGSHVITEAGMLAGTVKDFAFSEKSGELMCLHIEPEPGFPETCDISKVIKIAKERIMASRTLYDEKAARRAKKVVPAPAQVAAARPEKAPAPPVAAPQPAAETVAPGQPAGAQAPAAAPAAAPAPPAPAPVEHARPSVQYAPPPPAEPESPTPRVDSVRFQFQLDDLRKSILSEMETLYSTLFKEQLRVSFQEVVRLLMDRINALEPERQFAKFSEQILGEIRVILADASAKEETPEEPEPDLGTVLEEKINAAVTPRLDAAEARMESLAAALRNLAADQETAHETSRKEASQSAAEFAGITGDILRKALDAVEKNSRQTEERLKHIKEAADESGKQLAATLGSLGNEMRKSVEDTRASLTETLNSGSVEARLDTLEKSLGAEITSFREQISLYLPELLGKYSEEVKQTSSALSLRLPDAESIERNFKTLKDELSAELRERISAELDEIKQSTDAIARHMPSANRFDHTIESLREEFSAAMPDMLKQHSDAIFARMDEISSAIPKSGEFTDALGALKDELALSLPELFYKNTEETKRLLESLAGQIPTAEAFDRTAEKLKYELSLILPELLEKNFEEIRNNTTALSAELKDAVEKAGALADKIGESVESGLAAPIQGLRNDLASVKESMEFLKQQPGLVEDMLGGMAEQIGVALAAAKQELIAGANDRTDAVINRIGRIEKSFAENAGRMADARQASKELMESISSSINSRFVEVRSESEARTGGLIERFDRFEKTFAENAQRMAGARQASKELLESISSSLNARFGEVRSDVEDVLRNELARNADAAVARGEEVEKDIVKIRETVAGFLVELEKRDFEPLKNELLDELRSFGDTALKSEDITGMKKWIETSVESVVRGMNAEAQEKAAGAMTAMNRLREEAAVDLEQFRRDMKSMQQSLKEALHVQLDSELARLKDQFDVGIFKNEIASAAQTAMAGAETRSEEKITRLEGVLSQAFQKSAETKDAVAGAVQSLKQTVESMGGELQALRDGFKNGLNSLSARGDADSAEEKKAVADKLKDFERVTARMEQGLRESAGGLMDYVDRRIGERDEYIEDSFRKIADALEDLLRRPAAGGGLGDLFTGRLFNVFGAQPPQKQPDPSKRLTATGAPKKKPQGPYGAVEAAQVRRLSYLIGKQITRDIADGDGNVIARSGDAVDEEVIRVSRDAHKVLDLIRAVDLSAE